MNQLTNTADVTGIYKTFGVDNTTQLSVELTALSIEKTADKRIWVDGTLTYTITVENIDEEIPGDDVTSVVITDVIDKEIATYVTDSLTLEVGGIVVDDPDIEFNTETGELTVRIDTLAPRVKAVVTFEVERV